MPDNIETVVYGTDTWEKGTIGTRDVFHFEQPFIRDLRMYPDGSLGPRPRFKLWFHKNLPLSPNLGLGEETVVIPAVQRDTYLTTVNQGYLIVTSSSVSFAYLDALGTTKTTLAPNPATSTHGPYSWISRVGSFEWLVDDLFISLVGTTSTVEDVGAALETTFSGANTFSYRGSTVHQGRSYLWGPMLDGSDLPFNDNSIYYSDA